MKSALMMILAVVLATVAADKNKIEAHKEKETYFVKNVTKSKGHFDLSIRSSSAWEFDVDVFGADWLGASFSSLSIDKSKDWENGARTKEKDVNTFVAVVGAVPQVPPLNFYSYYTRHVNAEHRRNYLEWAADKAASMAVSAFVSLREYDVNGTLVREQFLAQNLLAPFSGNKVMRWTKLDYDLQSSVKYFQMAGRLDNEPWEITLTFLVTDVAGVIKLGETVVAPKVLETVVQIEGWQYEDPANSLSLVVAAASGNVSTSSHGIISKSGDSDNDTSVFFALKKEYLHNGEKRPASIKLWEKKEFSTVFKYPGLQAQLHRVFNGKFAAYVTEIGFEAGAGKILYDPAIGTGLNPYSLNDDDNASAETQQRSLLLAGLSLVGLVALVAVAAVAFLVVRRKRTQAGESASYSHF
jgi:hypothetical protein